MLLWLVCSSSGCFVVSYKSLTNNLTELMIYFVLKSLELCDACVFKRL